MCVCKDYSKLCYYGSVVCNLNEIQSVQLKHCQYKTPPRPHYIIIVLGHSIDTCANILTKHTGVESKQHLIIKIRVLSIFCHGHLEYDAYKQNLIHL